MSNLLGQRMDAPTPIEDGALTNTVRVNENGELMIAVSGDISISGGATEAKQDDEIAALGTINTNTENSATSLASLDGKVPADPSTVTSVDAVRQAIIDLGDGTTIDQVATAVYTVNTTLTNKIPDPYEVQPGIFATPVISAGGEVEAKQNGLWDVSVNNPITGYATENTLGSANSHLDNIDQKVATANNQTTQITYLTAIANDGAKDTSIAQGNASLDSIDNKVATETTVQAIADELTALGPWVDRDPVTVPAEPSAAQQLPNYPCSELKIIADRANTQPIYLGGSGVTSSKSQDLEARELEIITRVSNANQFYVVAAATHTGQKVRIQTR